MTTILTLNSSFKFTVNENTPRRGPKRSSQFINQYDPVNQKKFNSVGTYKSQSESTISKTTLSRQMEDFVSYVESGSVENALQLFDKMNKRSVFVWNLVIRVLTNNGFLEEALDLYHQMCIEGVHADNFTFPFVIKACGGCLDFVTGRKVHSKLFKVGLNSDLHIVNSLILMYAKLGYISYAEKVFDEMPLRDLVSWNSMINGYILINDGLNSLTCIAKMQRYQMKPDRFTIVSALHASSLVRSLPKAKEIHTEIIKNNFEHNEMIQTSLIDTYAKCGEMRYAKRIFDNISQPHIAAWNAMIHGHGQNSQPLESLSFFTKMQENNINPDTVSLITLLPSCSQLGSLLNGKTVHCYAIKMGFLPHIILETSLIDMYGKCGKPRLAKLTFNQMSKQNLISRNTLLTTLVQNAHNQEALNFFLEIWNDDDLTPDAITITAILPLYSEIGELKEGKQIHAYVIKSCFSSNTYIMNSLIYMYAKCSDLVSASDIFNRIVMKDVVSWNTIIMAYAIHGFDEVSIDLFSEMKKAGVKPNSNTFISVLYSCSVSGMVEKGWNFFDSMKKEYGIDACIEHYGCMVDLLGRVGDFDSAKRLITEMPLEPTSRIWGSLLGASRRYKNLELAEFVFEKIKVLEHDNTGLYVLLSNLYAETGRWEDVKRIKSLMESQRLTKTVGVSVINVKGKTFKFVNEDRSHEKSNLIYDVLDVVLKEPYDGDLCKFKVVDFLRKKSKSTYWHSVRLAVSFGLVSMAIGKPIHVRKNVRICEDCHDVMKRISLFCRREIVVGDSKIYHHFRNGECSCRDYW